MFVTFDGIDGSGKTTTILHVKEYLESLGIPVVVTRTPGGCVAGPKIRELVLNSESNLFDRSRLLFFLGDMYQTFHEVILPALESGYVVLCDRWKDSTFVYQIQTSSEWFTPWSKRNISDMMDYLIPNPALTLIFDLPVDEAMERCKSREGCSDVFERASLSVWEERRKAFLNLSWLRPFSYALKTIDVQGKSVRDVSELALEHIMITYKTAQKGKVA